MRVSERNSEYGGCSHDQRVFFEAVSWNGYETLLDLRGERPVPRLVYLEGTLELMSPSVHHEKIAKMLARLIEAYADERDLPLNGFKSWTVRREESRRGAEPDECYTLGADKMVPDLAIEVVWTSGGLDKLEVYRELGVGELWFWQDDEISVYVLRGDCYQQVERSELLPELDLAALTSFIDPDNQTQAV
ncbi:MAG TPA: Uma2 family endonuclease, partial [Kofleriaceae bacterium]|nr:Uma2 family endonuclease [Kofleriaceae bacterium]